MDNSDYLAASHHLERICGKLGIRLSHSRPFRPEGRGKIERLFRFVDTSFKHEAYLQIENGRLSTLSELNSGYLLERSEQVSLPSSAIW
ncbi:MAG: hypothetical protein KGZ53_02040 [Peptococcaceae bacterium]|nr:hypothetical protein [Peptococcaceae bacterium]